MTDAELKELYARDATGLTYVKSPKSEVDMSESVEVGVFPDGVRVMRNSNGGPDTRYTPAEWAAFIAGVKDGEFD
jgi:hypothetical protein